MTEQESHFPCPQCSGTGYIRSNYVPPTYDRFIPVYDTTTCWQCSGTGRI